MEKFKPAPCEVKKDKDYFWCSCGKSKKQPFCDGSHVGTDFIPLKYSAEKNETKFFCTCKKTKNKPFCDGSHKAFDFIENEVGHFFAFVEPDNKQIEVSVNESILTASLRGNVPHLSACGGTGKCSTCRVEIIDGLENCSSRSDLEQKLSNKLSFPENIRLACQTKINGPVSYRRLLLDKRDLSNSNQLANQKLESVGTIRNLSIMFCDIKGFTPFSESLAAYDVIFILNRYISIMRDIIIKNGGEVNNYIGDAILAIFGLKESRQQTLRAANAAVEMLHAMDEFKEYLSNAYGRDFDIRIGVHYGEVILGSVGFGEDKKFTVIGDTVNIASRIEAINKDSGTRFLISDVAYERIKESVEVRNFVRLKLRGSSQLITLHELSSINKTDLIDHSIVKEKEIDGENWLRTLPVSELEKGEKKKFEYDGKEILLINQKGIFAIENICPHLNLPLEIGQITQEGTILCPYHNSEFCFKTGEVRKWVGLQPKEAKSDCEPLKVISTKQADSYIWIQKPVV
jgi:class 3 adenylate cyclase/nitrite reductase/ring-hydroxylating ferredoxin subunit/CDGSH-type Zn-finger protein